MPKITALVPLFFCALLAEPFVPTAHAVSNTIPDAELLFSSAEGSTRSPAVALPYRGALGRVDTPIARAAVPAKRGGYATETVMVGSDAGCGSPRLARSGRSPSRDDFIVLLMFPPAPSDRDARPTPLVALAPSDKHESIVASVAAAGESIELVGVHSNDGVSIVEPAAAGGDVMLKLEYPDTAAVSLDGHSPITGPARIIVARADEPIPFGKTVKKCTRIAADDSFQPPICIDELFFDGQRSCGTRWADLHPGACHFVGGGARMNFAEQCFPGPNAGSHPAKCKGQPTGLEYTSLWPCGALLFEFSWREILDGGNRLAKRRLRGSTGVSKGGPVGDGALRIPGREFTGAIVGSGDSGASPSDFEPIMKSSSANSQLFEGSSDVAESSLYLYPRMQVARVCDGGLRDGQACAGVDGSTPVCACDPLVDRPCKCKSLGEGNARYFSCRNTRDLEELPCTRAQHCWGIGAKLGSCSGTPTCVPHGEVWASGKEHDGKACKVDADCSDGMQCGYSLFDFGDRDDHVESKIPYVITPDSKQRGICSRRGTKACGGDLGLCGPRDGECVGYMLEALERVEDENAGDPEFPSHLFNEEVPPGIVFGPEGVPDDVYGAFEELDRAAQEQETFY